MINTLIFEGIDKTGKDALINAIHKYDNWQRIVYNRGPLSYIMYNRKFSRDFNESVYWKELENLIINKTAKVVYCIATEEVIYNRMKELNSKDYPIKDILDNEYFDLKNEKKILEAIRIDRVLFNSIIQEAKEKFSFDFIHEINTDLPFDKTFENLVKVI